MKSPSVSRRDFLRVGGAALAATTLPSWLRAVPAEGGDRHVLYFTKSAGFEHSVVRRKGDELSHSEKIMKQLGERYGVEVTCSKDGRIFDGDIDRFDVFVFYTSGDLVKPGGRDGGAPMSPRGKERLLAAVKAGKGFVGVHAANDSFHSPGSRFENQRREDVDPYLAMLGGEFIRHGPQQKARMRIASPSFPGCRELGDGFTMHEEWYAAKNFAPDLHVVLVNETEGMRGKDYQRPPFPATWARRHGSGRVFYTSMGHREDVWTNEKEFQAILVGGIGWAMGEYPADVPPNIDRVTPKASTLGKE